jgi:hypothetical protein
MNRTILLAGALLALAACGDKHDADAAKADATRADAPAPPAPRQKTVFDDQLKAIDKAKGVEQQLQQEKEKHDRDIEAQENGDG